jgi:hypothetical protein
MRKLAFSALLFAAACGGSSMTPPGGDDQNTADANPGSNDDGAAIHIVTPDITLQPGDEKTVCYYFDGNNDKDINVKSWKSSLTPGSHHLILYTTSTDQQPPGTLSNDDCGFGTGSIQDTPIWTFASQEPEYELALPTDDGNGKPVGQAVKAHQPAYVQLHYLNSGENVLVAHAELEAFAYDEGTDVTPTAPFITYNNSISIPPGATNHVESETCTNNAAGAKFWQMSSHSHKQSVGTDVRDGDATGAMVFQSVDWEHPGTTDWNPAFYTFGNQFTWQCTYDNIGDNQTNTVVSGPSAATNEMCMAVGWYFPGTQPHGCFDQFAF